jgi:hypothetical protein
LGRDRAEIRGTLIGILSPLKRSWAGVYSIRTVYGAFSVGLAVGVICECSGRKEGEGGSRDGKRRYEEEDEGGELDHGVSSSEHPTRVGHALGSNKAYSHIPAYPSSLAQAKAPLQ